MGRNTLIAALYVEKTGVYSEDRNIDIWDKERDARLYQGPYPIIAHPPCQRWGKLWAGQPLWIKRTGERKIKGDDGGCFASALSAVRRWGGVIEHPWGSHAWPFFGLAIPPKTGGWIEADTFGGRTCCVEQGRYGHYSRKPTLLLTYRTILPDLDWGISEAKLDPKLVQRIGLKRAIRRGEVCSRGGGVDSPIRINTPEPFKQLLISLARSVNKVINYEEYGDDLLPRKGQRWPY